MLHQPASDEGMYNDGEEGPTPKEFAADRDIT